MEAIDLTEKQTKNIAYTKWKFIFLALYFAILTVERVISLVKFCIGGFKTADQLEYYMIMLTIFAIFGSYIFAVIRCMDVVKKRDKHGDIFSELAVAAGILLLGGMVHTQGSILPVQFISYGMILISMAIHTAENVKRSGGAAAKWISFGYIVAYSMAIPVVYHTNIKLANIFVPIECVVSAGMVAMFTILLSRFYNGNGESSFSPIPFFTAIIGDLAVLILRWEEEINTFVLIFLCVTVAMWIVGRARPISAKKEK